ncbi:MAG TPA: hypothetical protein VMN56_02525 [Casimicrobiaceae bacterium]|nr:hypothetical protein [Casimicrobiaceae bacterium]
MPSAVFVRSGRSYRVTSPPAAAQVTPELASELEHVLEKFALEAQFDERAPVSVEFRPGIFGHHRVGRAADIYGVGGVGIGEWKARWDRARERMRATADPRERAAIDAHERRRNLGWRLYKAQQIHGRWAQPYGYPIQLFGPWTRGEGPWKYISDRMLRAHADHIHVAK